MPELIYVNGHIGKPADARVSALDRGFLYGDALFETMRAREGRIFALDRHLARLASSAHALGMPLRHTAAQMQSIITGLVAVAKLPDAAVRLEASRGVGIGATGEPTLVIWVRQYSPPRGRAVFFSPLAGEGRERGTVVSQDIGRPVDVDCERGMSAVLSRYRACSDSPLVRHKTANYLACVMAKREAQAAGADEAILMNERGEATEGATSNIFIVRNGCVFTPLVACGLLPGITREVVITLCVATGIPCREWTLRPGDLFASDEIFITNSLLGVMPVRMVSGRVIATPRDGVTGMIARRYGEMGQ
jgi:branched-chain amino acid aminotransferase